MESTSYLAGLLKGMLIVRKIENVPCGANNKPRMDVCITGKLTILT